MSVSTGKIENYLKKLAEECNRFDLSEIPAAAGLEFDEELTLDQMYVDYTELVRPIELREDDRPVQTLSEPKRYLTEKQQAIAQGNVPVNVITAPPGGGKTTLLKRCVVALAEGNRAKLPRLVAKLLGDWEGNRNYLPVWIRPEEVEDFRNLQTVIQSAMEAVTPGAVLSEAGDWTYVLLIDGLDAFRSRPQQDLFLYSLREFYEEHRDTVILATARTEGYRKFRRETFCHPCREDYYFEDWKLPGVTEYGTLQEEVATMFAVPWLRILDPEELGREESAAEAAEELLRELLPQGIAPLLNTPLEVSNWLLVYLRDNCLPEDETEFISRDLEFRLRWRASDRYHRQDVKRHLARIAYTVSLQEAMLSENLVSVNNKLLASNYKRAGIEGLAHTKIFHKKLREIIRDTDRDFGRYFEYAQDASDAGIDAFLAYLTETGILRWDGETSYVFAYNMHQVYLAAFCIRQNLFPKEERCRNRAGYIARYLETRHFQGENLLWKKIILDTAGQNELLWEQVTDVVAEWKEKGHGDTFLLDCLMCLMKLPDDTECGGEDEPAPEELARIAEALDL